MSKKDNTVLYVGLGLAVVGVLYFKNKTAPAPVVTNPGITTAPVALLPTSNPASTIATGIDALITKIFKNGQTPSTSNLIDTGITPGTDKTIDTNPVGPGVVMLDNGDNSGDSMAGIDWEVKQ